MARRYTAQYFAKHAEALERGLEAEPLNSDYMQNRQMQLFLYMVSYEAFYDNGVQKEILSKELFEEWQTDEIVYIRIKGRMIREGDNTEWELRGRRKLAMISIPELDMMLNAGVSLRQNEIERNYLKINSVHREEKIENIRNIFKTFRLKMKNCVREIHGVFKGKHYNLTIHNVGQGQAVSVRADGENIPFLYFDYGCAYGNNLFTRAGVPIDMPTDKNTKIVVYWYAYLLNQSALTCYWIIPKKTVINKF